MQIAITTQDTLLTTTSADTDAVLRISLAAGQGYLIGVQFVWSQASPNDGGIQVGLLALPTLPTPAPTPATGPLVIPIVWTFLEDGVARNNGDTIGIAGGTGGVIELRGLIDLTRVMMPLTIAVIRGQSSSSANPTTLKARSFLRASSFNN